MQSSTNALQSHHVDKCINYVLLVTAQILFGGCAGEGGGIY